MDRHRKGPRVSEKDNQWAKQKWAEQKATDIVNHILEQLIQDHENDMHPHEAHQEDWENIISVALCLAMNQACGPTVPNDNMKFDMTAVLSVMEKLLFGIHTNAPAAWMQEQAKRAQEVFWFAKTELEKAVP